MPAVSIIVPVRDRPALLRRALDSVRAQIFADWEAIVVDDASTPPVEAPDDPRIRVLRLGRNRGPAAARNAGLAAARGAWAAFLDSDDEWRPAKLVSQLAEAHPGRVLVTGAALLDGTRVKETRPARPKGRGERAASYLYLANQFAQASCVLAPTELALAVGFDEGLRQYEDHLFLIRAEAAGAEVTISTAPLVRHHVDPRTDRLGRRDDPARAAAFLEAAGDLLTDAERLAFRLRCVAPALPAGEAVRLALTALAAPGAPKEAALKVLARAALGPFGYATLRRIRRLSMSPSA